MKHKSSDFRSLSDWRGDWETFYREVFGVKTDFAGVLMPKTNEKPSWFIFVPEHFSIEQIFTVIGERQFPVWKSVAKSFDEIVNLSFGRDGWVSSYVVRCSPKYETDGALKNLSAKEVLKLGVNTLGLREMLLLGGFVFWKERKHLDTRNITLCASSRDINGDVPTVDWRGGKCGLRVTFQSAETAGGGLYARVAVL